MVFRTRNSMNRNASVIEMQDGYTFFKSDPAIKDTVEVARKIGKILEIPGMPTVQTLRPRISKGEEKSNYSGNFGLNEFPLHTDLAHWYVPPRYFLLRCIRPSSIVTTDFVVTSKVFSQEDALVLKRSLFRPRRRLDGRLTILRLQEQEFYRWDRLFIRAMNKSASELQSRVEARLMAITRHKVALESRGDCILVDNWKIVHGRSSVPHTELNRKIERVYLSELKV